jgi:hypothetical protein
MSFIILAGQSSRPDLYRVVETTVSNGLGGNQTVVGITRGGTSVITKYGVESLLPTLDPKSEEAALYNSALQDMNGVPPRPVFIAGGYDR